MRHNQFQNSFRTVQSSCFELAAIPIFRCCLFQYLCERLHIFFHLDCSDFLRFDWTRNFPAEVHTHCCLLFSDTHLHDSNALSLHRNLRASYQLTPVLRRFKVVHSLQGRQQVTPLGEIVSKSTRQKQNVGYLNESNRLFKIIDELQ